MARARPDYTSQPERRIVQIRQRGNRWRAYLACGHWTPRIRRPRVGSIVVCWDCAERVQPGPTLADLHRSYEACVTGKYRPHAAIKDGVLYVRKPR